MRTIAAVTVARSDWGPLEPVLLRIREDERLRLRLIAGGAHLSPRFGSTVDEIERQGFAVDDRVECVLATDEPGAVADATAAALTGFGRAFARERPDLLLVLGDRFEMHAAGLAALPFRIPVAHVHGGESTEGAIDESLRHSLTKLSHLHFAATRPYADRIVRMGEEPWRVTVSGAPALDRLRGFEPLPERELASSLGLPLDEPPLAVTYHPATLERRAPADAVRAVLDAVAASGRPAVFTYPGADPGAAGVIAEIEAFAAAREHVVVASNLGGRVYFSLLARAAAMVGNSSSGIVEAASFGLPVVNVGSRQDGRIRGANVIDVDTDATAIAAGIERALDPELRRGLAGMANPYGDGTAAERIVSVLADVPLDDALLVKRFHDGGPA